MAWSIFTQGGGSGAALAWDQRLLAADNAPLTPQNEQFIYDWMKSEGGGGINNPLNQGPVPGNPSLTTSGSQYGGGAADYASIDSGIQGAVAYLHMPAYAGVQSALLQGTSYQAAAQALWASPWAASHYGYGKNWNTDPLPGQTSAIIPGSSNAVLASSNQALPGSPGAAFQQFSSVASALSSLIGAGNTQQQTATTSSGFLSSLDSLLNPSVSLLNPWRAVTMIMARTGFVVLGFAMMAAGAAIIVFGTKEGRSAVGIASRVAA